jgi:hypothetical protein
VGAAAAPDGGSSSKTPTFASTRRTIAASYEVPGFGRFKCERGSPPVSVEDG